MKKIILMMLTIFVFLLCSCSMDTKTQFGVTKNMLTSTTYTESGYTGILVSWTDASSKQRTAFLVDPTTTTDPSGSYGGYLRKYTYILPTNVTRTVNSGATQPGFGFAGTQRTSDYVLFGTKYTPSGVKTIVSSGPEHLVVQYYYNQLKASSGEIANIKTTVQWMFVSGKDHPIYSVTHDTSSYTVGAFSGNSVSPYGDMEYADVTTSTVDGIAWGDKWQFKTTSAPATMSSTWTYNVANTVPYLYAWNNTKNAEIGLLRTSTFSVLDAGQGIFYSNWNKTSTTKVVDSGQPASPNMPYNWNWTQSFHQWQLPTTTSKPIGWLMQYGATGTNSATKYTNAGVGTITGYPYLSYSLQFILGQKNVTSTALTNQLSHLALAVTASRGSVKTLGFAGVGRTDTIALTNGYNTITNTFDINCDATDAFTLSLNVGTKTIINPTFRVFGYTGTTPSFKYDGAALTSADYFTSFDSTNSILYVVLKKSFTGSHTFGLNDSIVVPPTPWNNLTQTDQVVSGYNTNTFTWQDSSNKTRSCFLVKNNSLDPASFYGGYVLKCNYMLGSTSVTADARSTNVPGWGYTVHHLNGGADRDTMSSRRAPGSFRIVFQGNHHAMYEYTWTILRSQGELPTYPQVDRNVNTTIRYVFSTAKDSVVWAHTVDTSPLGANTLNADDRAPYGELRYDGIEGAISGLGWGDRYKFRTTSSPVNFNSTWTYLNTNTVPHTVMWTDSNSSEMAVVQTEKYTTKDAGYGWFYTNWGKTSANKVIDSGTPSTQTMPYDWNWTYQLNQYNFPYDANSKLMAWGTNMGSVGQTSYPVYGDSSNISGYPKRNSSVLFNLGAKGSVDSLTNDIQAMCESTVTATIGSVTTSGPAGVGDSSTISYGTSSFDPVYSVYTLTAASNSLAASINLGTKTIKNPMFRIKSYTGTTSPVVKLNGVTLTQNVDYFVSVVSFDTSNEMWLTFNSNVTGTFTIAVN